MILNFVYNDTLRSLILPEKISGQFFFTSPDGKKVIRAEGSDDGWLLKSCSGYSIRSGEPAESSSVSMPEGKGIYLINNSRNSDDMIYLFTENYTENRKEFYHFRIPDSCVFTIGNGKTEKTIVYENEYVSSSHATLECSGGKWTLRDDGSRNGTFVNGHRESSVSLKYGDLIFIAGLKIIVGNGWIAANNPDGKVNFFSDVIELISPQRMSIADDSDEEKENDEVFFDRSPRFMRSIENTGIIVEGPPAEENHDEMPIALTVGPAMTMAMGTMTTGTFALTNAIASNNIKSAVPTLVMSCSMCLGTLLWPALSRKYNKKQRDIKEKQRILKYSEYLDRKRIEIKKTCEEQVQILKENNISVSECENRIMNIQRNLWERSSGQDDFMTFRVGIGDIPMYGTLQYPQRKFTMSEDLLTDKMLEMCEEPKILKSVPVAVSLFNQSLGIIGDRSSLRSFVKGMIVQLSALYSYDEVKLAFLYDEDDSEEFEFVKWLPHVWNDDRNFRMVASKPDEAKAVASHIENVFSSRDEKSESSSDENQTYYVVVVLSKKQFDRADVLKRILSSGKNVSISVVTVFEELRMLPKECSAVIELSPDKGRLYNKNDTSGGLLEFVPDMDVTKPVMDLSVKLANIRLDESNEASGLPKMITFLQMMGAGKVEQLNSLLRWKENDPTKSLAVPVGVNPYGDLFMLDLHEKFHGPHGLVAGMTGSGKSEFVIAYILSLAVNFHPDEVSFIMIDYKGGGMAKSFEKLPHTAGIITNLDGSAIKRSLVSINSELKRRQAILAGASRITGESNMNIYQYQKLYREHTVSEPLSHLFIIADEFAELKTQQPDFMKELVSAARIGRSLGVHLILATQKPSGVVDDQIWSNSRFRVCLKVQEKQDSNDMLKRPDAAELADTGRFYLQVGYNELFELGQSAWAGAEYYPSEHVIVEKDNSVDAIDMNGQVIRSAKLKHSGEVSGKQLDRITSYLEKLAEDEGIRARQLWLEPLSENITLDELKKRYPAEYSESRKPFVLNPVIGEYDDPANQKQGLLTVPFSAEGNLIVYGTAGSGDTQLINTIIYSLITEHTPDEVNFYILDFSDETLTAFSKAPHVGEVMLSNDGEKISRFFRSLYGEIKKRKKKLSHTGMDFITYSQKHPEKCDMPAMIIVISNFSAFSELYSDNEDDVVFLSREGSKYGIYFVLSSLTTSGIRFRISQNFRQHLVLQQNDDGDYSSVLGKTEGLFPAKFSGRGLVKTDKIYEFQTAYIENGIPAFDSVRKKCAELASNWSGRTAEKIPVLPDVVDSEFVLSYLNENKPLIIPVGVNKNTLKVQYYNFERHCINMLLSADNGYLGFTREFLNVVSCISGLNLVVFDPSLKLSEDSVSADNEKIRYYRGASECSEGVMWMFDELVRRNNTYKTALNDKTEIPVYEYTMCIIISMNALEECLDGDRPERLKLLLEKNDSPYRFSVFIADEAREVSTYSYTPWYKKHVAGNEGIWYGNGVTEQYSLKANATTSAMRQPVSVPLGYVFEKGEAVLCKLLSESGDTNE